VIWPLSLSSALHTPSHTPLHSLPLHALHASHTLHISALHIALIAPLHTPFFHTPLHLFLLHFPATYNTLSRSSRVVCDAFSRAGWFSARGMLPRRSFIFSRTLTRHVRLCSTKLYQRANMDAYLANIWFVFFAFTCLFTRWFLRWTCRAAPFLVYRFSAGFFYIFRPLRKPRGMNNGWFTLQRGRTLASISHFCIADSNNAERCSGRDAHGT